MGGNANGPQEWTSMTRGAGITIHEGAPTIQYCIFTANAAQEEGGAMHADHSHPTVIDCTFICNYSEKNSGALSLMDSHARIAYCRFLYNRAGDAGGAVTNHYGQSSITECAFTENWAVHHGGAMYNYYSDVLVTACTFIRNTSGSKGGAVYSHFSSAYNNHSPAFRDCRFFYNETLMRGGAIQNSWCNAVQTHCVFTGNHASDEGGAVHNDHSEPTYVNCLFNKNHADIAGGAMCNFDAHTSVINCTFFANTAPKGRAVASTDTSITHSLIQVANSILWDEGNEITQDNEITRISATYSNIYDSYQGTGNVFTDPRFINALGPDGMSGTADDNLRLSNISPCIDAAEYFAVPVDVNTDLDGNPRFLDDPATLDTGHGSPPMVDMGAYEFDGYDPNTPDQCGPTPPIPHAGSDQTAYAWIDGYALVNLDGSDSFDPDGDPLFYSWTWSIDNQVYHDGGARPTIECPTGEHVIELTVSDCAHVSMPACTVVTVIPPLQAPLWLHPYPVRRQDTDQQHVLAMLYVYGTAEDEIDLADPLILYPGNVPAASQYAYETHDGGLLTTVIVMFDKGRVLNALEANGYYNITIAGQLHTGRFYFGTDEIWVTD
jgi:predicted outer membrane repeat protein